MEPKISWKRPRTFKTESGEVLPLCPVNEFDLAPFIKQLTAGAPKPPLETVDGVSVANEAHPDYLDALQTHNLTKGAYMMALYIEFGLDMELDEAQQASIGRAKRKMERINPGAPENKLDLFIYAKSVCTSAEELTRLMQTIQALNTPSLEQVQDHLDTFRPDVSRPTAHGNQDATERGGVTDRLPETNPVQGGNLGAVPFENLLREARPRVAG
jgi:hypothetical protein